VHRWLGIGLGVWFALVGITGSILVFEDEIDAWLNPELLTSKESGAWLAPEALLQKVETSTSSGASNDCDRPRRPPRLSTDIRTQPNRRASVRRVEATFAPVSGQLLERDPRGVGLAARCCCGPLRVSP